MNDKTGEQTYRYVKTGPVDHYSMAFTYDCIAWSRFHSGRLSRTGVISIAEVERMCGWK